MSMRYSAADFGHDASPREFKKRYSHPWKGDGWYLLLIGEEGDQVPAAVLAQEVNGTICVRGWWVVDDAAKIIDANGDGEIREREF